MKHLEILDKLGEVIVDTPAECLSKMRSVGFSDEQVCLFEIIQARLQFRFVFPCLGLLQ